MLRTLPFVWLLTACPAPSDTDPTEPSVPDTDPVCTSGTYWTGGNEESPNMNPGEDCVACHASGEGPNFTVGGTVMGDYADQDDCNGVKGVSVQITDANGNLHEFESNNAGNFYTNQNIALPVSIVLEYDGRTRAMLGSPDTLACNSCHTVQGENDAPGRILAP